MMKQPFLLLPLALLGLSACTGPVIMAGDAAAVAFSKPAKGDPADMEGQIPPHQSWCYSTMGDVECYAHPQDTQPHRLVNVDPPSAYPIDADAYRKAVADSKRTQLASASPTALTPIPVVLPGPSPELPMAPAAAIPAGRASALAPLPAVDVASKPMPPSSDAAPQPVTDLKTP